MRQSSYAQALAYLYEQLPMFHRIGPAALKKDLTNTLAFCEYLGHPEQKFPCIHIAGTNGKGSTAHFLAAILTARGFKTGLYTSPHYRDFRERVKVDGKLISRPAVVSFVEKHRAFSEKLQPSFFEWTVALAFDHFARQKVDIAIIETGLGGRLDSTNVVTPLVSVITNIGFDHVAMLGDTLPLIAAEKAGIIKPGVPVVIGETHPETAPVFLEKAALENAPIVFADQHFQAEILEKNDTHTQYAVRKDGQFLKKISMNHLADYQSKNLCTVLQAMVLVDEKYPRFLPKKNTADPEAGLQNVKVLTGFLGRWEYLSQSPRVLCDSAHNEDGVRLAVEGLQKISHRKLHFVFGAVNDKEPDKVLALLPKNAVYYFAKANIPRGLNAQILQENAGEFGLRGKAYSSVRLALAAAKRSAGPEDLVFVGGSIFVVAEVV